MKPCAHCGHALPNGAKVCSHCARPLDDRVRVNPKLTPKHGFPPYSIWSDLIITLVLAAAGFYFFGLLGALAGLGLGIIIAIGF